MNVHRRSFEIVFLLSLTVGLTVELSLEGSFGTGNQRNVTLITTAATWFTAQETCVDKGGQLFGVTVRQTQYDLIYDENLNGPYLDKAWFAAINIHGAGSTPWLRPDCSEFSDEVSPGSYSSTPTCAYMDLRSTWLSLKEASCSEKLPFVCFFGSTVECTMTGPYPAKYADVPFHFEFGMTLTECTAVALNAKSAMAVEYTSSASTYESECRVIEPEPQLRGPYVMTLSQLTVTYAKTCISASIQMNVSLKQSTSSQCSLSTGSHPTSEESNSTSATTTTTATTSTATVTSTSTIATTTSPSTTTLATTSTSATTATATTTTVTTTTTSTTPASTSTTTSTSTIATTTSPSTTTTTITSTTTTTSTSAAATTKTTTTATTTTSSTTAGEAITDNTPTTTTTTPTTAGEAITDNTPTTTTTTRCKCTCLHPNEDQLSEMVEKLQKELTVEKSSTGSSKRKKISAEDRRISSTTVGLTATVVICVIFGLMIVTDLLSLIKGCHKTNPPLPKDKAVP